jgi:GNAT superfamily N-acetyltransferase
VARPQVLTRIAIPDDLPTLLALWEEIGPVGGRAERALNPVGAGDVGERLREAMTDPSCRVVLACDRDDPAGMGVFQVLRPDPLSDLQLVQIAHLVVTRAKRNQGVGNSLIAAAADFAAERHVDHVAVGVYPSLREANRFYARLGFAPVALRRFAPVAVLRRRLGNDRSSPILGDAVRRRTRLGRPVPPQRRRTTTDERIES